MLPKAENCSFIEPSELSDLNAVIIDVRTVEAFDEVRLPGSVNHCVYEVVFTETLSKAYPEKHVPLVVYGEGPPWQADLAAVGRLNALGYTRVFVLRGGLSRWISEGRTTEGSDTAPVSIQAGQFRLDAKRSKVRWVGRNLTNQHDGTVECKHGFMELDEAGTPIAGEVVVDLTRMSCRDIEDKSLAGVLIAHLQNADFFDVAKFPEASFVLHSSERMQGASYGKPNFRVSGSLTARGRSIPLVFDALVESTGDEIVFQANFNFDRVSLGACYGSGRLFERLGMHLVNDLVSMDIGLVFEV